jgi:hypothetical protein
LPFSRSLFVPWPGRPAWRVVCGVPRPRPSRLSMSMSPSMGRRRRGATIDSFRPSFSSVPRPASSLCLVSVAIVVPPPPVLPCSSPPVTLLSLRCTSAPARTSPCAFTHFHFTSGAYFLYMMGSAAFTSTTAEDVYSTSKLFLLNKILSSPFTIPFHLRSVAFTFTMPAPRCVLKFLFLKK